MHQPYLEFWNTPSVQYSHLSFNPMQYYANNLMANSFMVAVPPQNFQTKPGNYSSFYVSSMIPPIDTPTNAFGYPFINYDIEKTNKSVQCQGNELANKLNLLCSSQNIENFKKSDVTPSIQNKEEKIDEVKKEGKNRMKKKRSQTKNLIKNYGRAILSFILKNHNLRKKVLQHLNIPDDQFQQIVRDFRQEVHTISGSRYLWQSHPYSKAFRILSCEFLRKYNLHHVFNSRIQKFNIYLKYQNKMMSCLKSPKQFQSIKDF